MYSKTRLALKYIQYYLTAPNGRGHGVHSPFVFEFIQKVLNDTSRCPAYEQIESLRRQYLENHTLLTVEDLGAGSFVSNTNKRSISSIARYAVKSKKIGQLLFRMVQFYQPRLILELGTSLGITSAYLARGNPSAKLITIEGADAIAAVAEESFRVLGLSNVKLKKGDFENILPAVLDGISAVDLAFIDGNHRLEPTLRYFNLLLSKAGNDSVMIFDDIHWSRQMEEAWETIKAHEAVRCTIDLFFIGIVFFRREFRERRHFVIRF
jgi:predicted O-methyltransferase YrrM